MRSVSPAGLVSVRALKRWTGDYAIGWKRPSNIEKNPSGIQQPIRSHSNRVLMGSREAVTILPATLDERPNPNLILHCRRGAPATPERFRDLARTRPHRRQPVAASVGAWAGEPCGGVDARHARVMPWTSHHLPPARATFLHLVSRDTWYRCLPLGRRHHY